MRSCCYCHPAVPFSCSDVELAAWETRPKLKSTWVIPCCTWKNLLRARLCGFNRQAPLCRGDAPLSHATQPNDVPESRSRVSLVDVSAPAPIYMYTRKCLIDARKRQNQFLPSSARTAAQKSHTRLLKYLYPCKAGGSADNRSPIQSWLST